MYYLLAKKLVIKYIVFYFIKATDNKKYREIYIITINIYEK